MICIVNDHHNAFTNLIKPQRYAKFDANQDKMSFNNDLSYKYHKESRFDKVSSYIQDGDKFLNCNNQKSAKDIKPIDLRSQSLTVEQKTNCKSVYLRRDIVVKAIIRAINKFFHKNFKSNISYRRKTKDVLYSKFTNHTTRVLESYQNEFNWSHLTSTKNKIDLSHQIEYVSNEAYEAIIIYICF